MVSHEGTVKLYAAVEIAYTQQYRDNQQPFLPDCGKNPGVFCQDRKFGPGRTRAGLSAAEQATDKFAY